MTQGERGRWPMSAQEMVERYRVMTAEDEAVLALLDEVAECEVCGRGRKDGAKAGCLSCIALDVMRS